MIGSCFSASASLKFRDFGRICITLAPYFFAISVIAACLAPQYRMNLIPCRKAANASPGALPQSRMAIYFAAGNRLVASVTTASNQPGPTLAAASGALINVILAHKVSAADRAASAWARLMMVTAFPYCFSRVFPSLRLYPTSGWRIPIRCHTRTGHGPNVHR